MKARVTFKIGNKTVSPRNAGRELERAISLQVDRAIDERASDLARSALCPRHGRTGRAVRRGGKIFIEGCCPEFDVT